MDNRKWLDVFRPVAIVYEESEPEYQSLHVQLVQARRVGRIRKQILLRQAIGQGLAADKGLLHFLASGCGLPNTK